MAWTGYQRFLALMMVVTGSINTLSTKWADNIKSKGSDGQVRTFEHPFLQVSKLITILLTLKHNLLGGMQLITIVLSLFLPDYS